MTTYQFAELYKGRRVKIADSPDFHPDIRGIICIIARAYNDEQILVESLFDRYVIPMRYLTLLLDNNPLPLPG